MKNFFSLMRKALAAAATFALVTGCVKDTCKRTYTIYTPVYKTTAEVRANIKSNGPVPVTKPGKMFVLGNYIFLNEIDKGIHIIDNTNPGSPVNKYFIDIPGNLDVAVKGNILYADLYTDMVTIDIANPAQVQVKNITQNAFQFRRYSNGFVAEPNKVIVDWITKDTTVGEDCDSWFPSNRNVLFFQSSSFGSASSAASAPVGVSGSMARFSLLNNYLYTVTETALNVFNITQPENPTFSNVVNIGSGIETIYPFKNNLFIGSSIGMFIYNTTNPAMPARTGSFTHARACDPVIADDNFAYVTLRSGTVCQTFTNQLDILNISNLSSPVRVNTQQLKNPHGLSKDGNLLFICDGVDGLKVFDATDVKNLKLVHHVKGIETYDVIAFNNVARVVCKDGLYQYNYSNPTQIQFLSKVSYQK